MHKTTRNLRGWYGVLLFSILLGCGVSPEPEEKLPEESASIHARIPPKQVEKTHAQICNDPEHKNCGHKHGAAGHQHGAAVEPTPPVPRPPEPDAPTFKALFMKVIRARLAGDPIAFTSLFAPSGYDLDYKRPFSLGEKRIRSDLIGKREGGVFAITAKRVFQRYGLAEHKPADLVDPKGIRVLGHGRAVETFRNRTAGRLSRIFYRGAFQPGDVFVIAPCPNPKFVQGAVTCDFNEHLFVGLEKAPDHIFYIFRKVGPDWKAVLLND